MDLSRIEKAANTVLNEVFHIELPEGIRTKWRNWEIVLCRHFYFKIALEADYPASTLARNMGLAPSAINSAMKNIDEKIKKYEEIYIKIKELSSGDTPAV